MNSGRSVNPFSSLPQREEEKNRARGDSTNSTEKKSSNRSINDDNPRRSGKEEGCKIKGGRSLSNTPLLVKCHQQQ
jgi:hypothetical protein